MKKFIEEFKAFALRGNMMDMAVGVIIGGGFTGIVTSLTDNGINPLLNFITGAETYTLQNIAGFGSKFISDFVNFLILAFVLFCLLKGNVTAVLFMPFVDETIQLFVEGRSGQISDVWLDMAGIVTGIMVTAGFMKMTGALKTGRKAAKGKGSGNRSRNNEL